MQEVHTVCRFSNFLNFSCSKKIIQVRFRKQRQSHPLVKLLDNNLELYWNKLLLWVFSLKFWRHILGPNQASMMKVSLRKQLTAKSHKQFLPKISWMFDSMASNFVLFYSYTVKQILICLFAGIKFQFKKDKK